MNFIDNNKFFHKKMAIWILSAVFLVMLDRFFKLLSLSQIDFIIINDWIKFSLAKNYFIAFSLPLSGYFLNFVISIIILSLTGYILIDKKIQSNSIIAYIFIILGASSNLFDRFKYGFVIDYINLKWFAVFNIADVLIVFSIIFLLFNKSKK